MKSKVLSHYNDDCFILRLSKDNLSDGTVLYNVSLEANLATMSEADFKKLSKAKEVYAALEESLKILSQVV